MSDPFADIRPYHDQEVAAVLERLLGDREFLETLATRRRSLEEGVEVEPSIWEEAKALLARA